VTAPATTAAGLVQDAETLAVELLAFLASRVGIATLAEIVDVLTGNSERELVEPLSEFAGQLAQDALDLIGPTRTKAALQSLYASADARVDALEDAKFPKGAP
jgi:hypothetical protein